MAGRGFEKSAAFLSTEPVVASLGDVAVEAAGKWPGEDAEEQQESPGVGHAPDQRPEGGWAAEPLVVAVN